MGIINFDVLIENCSVITMDSKRRKLNNTCIGILNDKITYLGDYNENFNAKKIIKGPNKVAIPGLIDTHAHAGHRLLQNMEITGVSKKLSYYYQDLYYRYTTQKFWFSEAMLSGIEKLKFGITTGVSFLGSNTRFDELAFSEAHVEGMIGVGIRDIMCVGLSNPPFPKSFVKWNDMRILENNELYFEDSLNYIKKAVRKFNGANSGFTYCSPSTSLYRPGISFNENEIRSIYKEIIDISKDNGTHIHSSSYVEDIKFTKENFNLLSEKVIIVNRDKLSDEEIKIIKELDISVCCSPYIEENSIGRSSVVDLIEEGVNITFCTDAGVNENTYDLIEKTNMIVQLERSFHNDNSLIPPEIALEMITINAAKALGLDNIIGSIEIGKKADITIIDIEGPQFYPHSSEPNSMIHKANGNDVDTVIIDGRVLMEGRKLVDLNEKKILVSAQNEAQKIFLRGGLLNI